MKIDFDRQVQDILGPDFHIEPFRYSSPRADMIRRWRGWKYLGYWQVVAIVRYRELPPTLKGRGFLLRPQSPLAEMVR